MKESQRHRQSLLMLMLMFIGALSSWAQTTISGTVEDSAGEPLIGASVFVKDAKTGTTTDIDGNFKIEVLGNNATLIVSYVGYKSAEVTAKDGMKIVLEEDNNLLDEVVVIGYGSVRRKDVTTAISTVIKTAL